MFANPPFVAVAVALSVLLTGAGAVRATGRMRSLNLAMLMLASVTAVMTLTLIGVLTLVRLLPGGAPSPGSGTAILLVLSVILFGTARVTSQLTEGRANSQMTREAKPLLLSGRLEGTCMRRISSTRLLIGAVFATLVTLGSSPVADAQTPTSSTASLIVKLVAGLSPTDAAAVVAENGGTETSSIPVLRLHVVEILATDLAAILSKYQADARVESVEQNLTRKSETLPSDPLYQQQWALPQIQWDSVFGTVTPLGAATVAILDTGIDGLHPDLAAAVVAGTSIVDGSNGLTDPSGHGTQMAGIVGAATNSVPVEGVAGVAYAGVRMMPVAVLDANGLGLDSDIIAGVVWAADHGADVILMAFSNPSFSASLQDAIAYAWSKGILVVAAVGNGASNTPTFPAGDRGVVGVAATDPGDAPWPSSNSGQAVFLAAPGTAILTTTIGDAYTTVTGTSASAAIVAGVAAFMRAVDPTLTNGVIVARMARTADPAGTQDQTGNGRINMARALADTGTDFIQPAGAAPVGAGGPFVGPYTTATVASVSITAPTSQVTITALPAIVTVAFSYSTSTGGTTSAEVDLLATPQITATKSGLASGVGKSDSIDLVIPTGLANGTYNVKVVVTNTFGSGANQKTTTASGLVNIAVPADTTPPSISPTITGTQGQNGWYTSDVTVTWSVTDTESGIASSTGCGDTTLTAETTGTTLTCSATNGAGLANSASVTIKLDKTPPTGVALSVTAGTLGTGGWYTSDVTVHTAGSETISGPVACTADQVQTTDTTGTVFNGSCTNQAGLKADAAPLTVKLDKTGPVVTLAVVAGTAGTNGWYTSDVTVKTQGTDAISGIATCTADQFQTAETTGAVFGGSCTNGAGLTTNATPLTIKLDKTPPTGVALAVTGGTLGTNGWYTSDVTLHVSGTDTISGPVACTTDQVVTTETTGTIVNGSCTNQAGLTASATPVTIKLDKTGPVVGLAVVAGTAGANGWYTSDVTVRTQGSDPISGIATCTADQFQTTETTGTVFNGSCTNGAGLSTSATPLTVKLDRTPPTSVTLAVIAGTPGTNGWYTSDVTLRTSGTDSISGPVTCTPDQFQTTETTGTVFNGSCTNQAGLMASATPVTVKLDKTPPAITIAVPLDTGGYVFNSAVPSSYSCDGGTSGTATCAGPVISGVDFDTASVGAKTFTIQAADQAGNTSSRTVTYTVLYAWTGLCDDALGHEVLQPINPDGTSVFKQKSTVPVKFRVCDANGTSIGTSGVVAGFRLYQVVAGTVVDFVDEAVDSTTPDTLFRWDPTAEQWIFNVSTKPLAAGQTYFYRITLNDTSVIELSFGLK